MRLLIYNFKNNVQSHCVNAALQLFMMGGLMYASPEWWGFQTSEECE